MMPKERQTLFFSATMPREIRDLSDSLLINPVFMETAPVASPAESVKQSVYLVMRPNKPALLERILRDEDVNRALIFTRTKHGADRVVKQLGQIGVQAGAIHSNKSQNARTLALKGFKSGRVRVLVATDIASRGIDVDQITHVINYDLPNLPDTYVHRIGRTGRAEATGDAFTLMVAEDVQHVDAVERFIGRPIERTKLDDFKYTYTTILDEKRFKGVSVRDRKMKTARIGKGQHFGFGGRRRR